MPVREAELGRRQPAGALGRDHERPHEHSDQSLPYAPAFIQTPPPAVPGIAQANSKPPRPASRARWRQTAFVAPPPATSTSPSTVDRGELAREPEHERVDAVVGGEQVRAEPDDARPPARARAAQRERLLELGERRAAARTRAPGRRYRSSSAARAGRPPRSFTRAPRATSGPARSTSPAPTRQHDVAGPRPARDEPGAVLDASAPSRAHPGRARERVDDELAA